jgi:hypothetical protein
MSFAGAHTAPLDSACALRSRHKRRIWNSGFGLKKKFENFAGSSPQTGAGRRIRSDRRRTIRKTAVAPSRATTDVATERRDSYCGVAQVPDTCARTSPLAMNVELGRLCWFFVSEGGYVI